MSSKSEYEVYADRPFKLIETPAHATNGKAQKGPSAQFVEAASIMALIHNMITRSLNSIYLQAAHMEPNDYKDFIGYASCWYEILEKHHHIEEEEYFPKIEAATGEKGLMDGNVKQHQAFLAPLAAYKTYLLSVSNNPEAFSGIHLTSLIDDFAPTLFDHLRDEIPSLLSLSRFGPEKLPLADIWKPIGRKSGEGLSKTGAFMFFLLNIDLGYEDGIWNWPPIPTPVRWMMIRLLSWQNRGWWRFASCGYDGHLKKLYASGE